MQNIGTFLKQASPYGVKSDLDSFMKREKKWLDEAKQRYEADLKKVKEKYDKYITEGNDALKVLTASKFVVKLEKELLKYISENSLPADAKPNMGQEQSYMRFYISYGPHTSRDSEHIRPHLDAIYKIFKKYPFKEVNKGQDSIVAYLN